MEIRGAFEALKKEKTFLASLVGQPEYKKAYEEFQHVMNDSHSVLKSLRNEISGHLKDKAFKGGLKRIEPTTKQLFQGGNNPRDIHYKFALEFIGAVMLRGARKHPARKWKNLLKRVSNASFKAIHAIDSLFFLYVEQRKLLE